MQQLWDVHPQASNTLEENVDRLLIFYSSMLKNGLYFQVAMYSLYYIASYYNNFSEIHV